MSLHPEWYPRGSGKLGGQNVRRANTREGRRIRSALEGDEKVSGDRNGILAIDADTQPFAIVGRRGTRAMPGPAMRTPRCETDEINIGPIRLPTLPTECDECSLILQLPG